MVDRAAVFEAAGAALFGPMALSINVPDEGNVRPASTVAGSSTAASGSSPTRTVRASTS
jgi:acyl-CoA dehydrogenase